MKIKLGYLTDLKGSAIKNTKGEKIRLSQSLAEAIILEEAKDSSTLHKYELALKLNSEETDIFDITDSEKSIILQTIDSGKFKVLVAAQILKALLNPIED